MTNSTDMIEHLVAPYICIIKNGDFKMKIEKMVIDNICGIRYLELKFNKGLNLICGENGVGKTTILKAIAHEFVFGYDYFIKKHYGSDNGHVEIWIEGGDTPIGYEIEDFIPGKIERYNIDNVKTDNLIYFSPSRTINYQKLDALPAVKTKDKNNHHSAEILIDGVKNDIKAWFINRLVFSKIDSSLSENQMNNLKLSQKAFNLLDNNLSVKTAKPDYEIILKKKNDEIYFEMLSDGYKSCIFIMLGIIKEIEYRYPEINAVDFDGIIMIDEIDIHLHPQWQAKIVNVLKETFPNAQIIATTHSPSVLQTAKAEEIIPLYKDKEENTCIKELNLGKYGLQGWTLEEILENVMGMPLTNSQLYMDTIHKFDKAMNEEDQEKILQNYSVLKEMLHPNNPLLQLLEIQVAEWKD